MNPTTEQYEDEAPEELQVPAKKDYHAPEFKDYGDIRELTKGNADFGNVDEPPFTALRSA